MRLQGTSVHSQIKLQEEHEAFKVPNEIQVLRIGKFNHPVYGAFEITEKVLAEMKANFDLKIRGIDMAFDYFHDSDKDASAWVRNLELRENATELWAQVDWTPKARQKLAERELRYFSPDFAFQWTDPETGTTFENVLFGGGLTNRPFVKEMMAIVADENQIGATKMTELEKVSAEVKKLSEQMAKLAVPAPVAPPAAKDPEEASEIDALKKTIADLQAALAKAQGDNQVMMAEKDKAQAAVKMAEQEKAFNVLLSEGKACAAQKDAFIKGDMNEFIKLAQKVNLNGSGSSESGSSSESDDTKAIIKLAEEKQKANPKMNRGEAISLAKKELKK